MSAPDPDLLGAAMRRRAEGDRAEMAAVALLVAHRRWLHEPAFTRCVLLLDAGRMAVVDWHALRQLHTDRAAPCSTSEWAVLGVAIDLVTGALGDAVGSCDTRNSELIAGAVACALRVRDLPPAPEEF